jgi:hypothetical protein
VRAKRKPGSQSANGRNPLGGVRGAPMRMGNERPHGMANGWHKNGKGQLRTLVIHLPLYHNPDGEGHVNPVDPSLLDETFREIRTYFTGYTSYVTAGWFRDTETEEEFSDETMRIEIDARFANTDRYFLRRWRQQLEARFDQRCICMKILGSVEWI